MRSSLPYGLVEAEVHRRPWVSITIGGICLLVQLWASVTTQPKYTAQGHEQWMELRQLAKDGGFTPGPKCADLLGDERLPARIPLDDSVERRARAEELCPRLRGS